MSDKIFDGQNISSDKTFDTKPKFRQFCPIFAWFLYWNIGQNFRRTKRFVGQNFRHQAEISTLLSDKFLSDKVCANLFTPYSPLPNRWGDSNNYHNLDPSNLEVLRKNPHHYIPSNLISFDYFLTPTPTIRYSRVRKSYNRNAIQIITIQCCTYETFLKIWKVCLKS